MSETTFPEFSCAVEPERTKRFIYNSGGSNIFTGTLPPMTPEDVYPFVD